MDSRIEVEIFGEKICLLSSEDENYIKEIAKYVDNKMAEVFKFHKIRSAKSLADCILLGVNIADDLFKRIREIEKAIDLGIAEQNKKPAKEEASADNEKQALAEKQLNDLKNQLKAERENSSRQKRLIEKLNVKLDNKTKEAQVIKNEFNEYIEAFGKEK